MSVLRLTAKQQDTKTVLSRAVFLFLNKFAARTGGFFIPTFGTI